MPSRPDSDAAKRQERTMDWERTMGWSPEVHAADLGAANVQREVATVMKALAPMGGTKEQSDACIALGRLAAWAEAGLTEAPS